jgi:hypothetical protein
VWPPFVIFTPSLFEQQDLHWSSVSRIRYQHSQIDPGIQICTAIRNSQPGYPVVSWPKVGKIDTGHQTSFQIVDVEHEGDGHDGYENPVPAGIYLCRFTAEDQRQTMKMTLLK